MKWSDIGGIVGKAAPWIGSLLGGKAGEKAGSLVARVLGCANTPEAVDEALKNNPDALVKLKTAEMEHVERLKEIATEEKALEIKAALEHRKIDVGDIQDARGRDINLKKAGYKNTRADIMIAIAFISFVLICWMINSNTEIKPGVLAIFNMSIGALLKMLGDAFQFEFGSSRGSKEKDSRPPA